MYRYERCFVCIVNGYWHLKKTNLFSLNVARFCVELVNHFCIYVWGQETFNEGRWYYFALYMIRPIEMWSFPLVVYLSGC